MNRLAAEKSPYLRQHASNPVDWYAWGEEAFAKARAEDKPIFLSIGYSTCHWCHVMAHESFENPATAEVMNALFVNIKLDREERPDVDRVYMAFVQAYTGSGGWPMSVWLQPDLKPFVGGTYFPPDDRFGRRGFVSVCRAVAHAWNEDREKVLAHSAQIMESLRELTLPKPVSEASRDPQLLARASVTLARSFDPEWGGFGQAPKFPRPVTLSLLARIQAHGDPAAREMLGITLDRMAAGGMHDQIGGGFHRYSVDRFWHVPHFEKMLYDQAQLAMAYIEAFQIGGDPAHAAVARDILDYVARDLTSPEGGFYCAEDADSGPQHAEGAFYVWTKAEIESLLTREEAAAVCLYYGVEAAGNSPPGSDPHGELAGKNTLTRQSSGPPPSARERLFAAREMRPRPHRDDKVLTAWNGLMISAFARASRVLGQPGDLATARRAADFVRRNLRSADGSLLRSYMEGPAAIPAFADDYAFLIQGLLDCYEADFDPAHLAWAEELQDRQDALFYDAPRGGYFAAAEDPRVLLRLKEDHDGAEPSASAISAFNLGRLAILTGREDFREKADATVRAFGAWDQPERLAQTMPMLLAAADFLASAPVQLVILGDRDAADTHALLQAASRHFLPNLTIILLDGSVSDEGFLTRMPFLSSASRLDGRATAYLCQHGACQLPTSDPETLSHSVNSV
jgi:uncharacterized protein YyaL (SSP411 family)